MVPGKVTGFVLAGGLSSRMGEDKSLMLFRGKPLIMYAIEALSPLCEKVIISSNLLVYDFTGCEVWPDELPVQAPINGLYSCLKRSETDWNYYTHLRHALYGFIRCFPICLNRHVMMTDAVIPVHGQGTWWNHYVAFTTAALLTVIESQVQELSNSASLKLLQSHPLQICKHWTRSGVLP